MSTQVEALGSFGWLLALCFVLVLVLALWSAWKLFRPGALPDAGVKIWVDATLFWGVFGLIISGIGALVGVIEALQGIEATGRFLTPQSAPGIKLAVLSSLSGVLILAVAAFLWFFLQLKWRLLKVQTD